MGKVNKGAARKSQAIKSAVSKQSVPKIVKKKAIIKAKKKRNLKVKSVKLEETPGLLKFKVPQSKLSVDQVESGIDALLKVLKENRGNKPELFDDERAIFMQINTIKIPKCPPRLLHFSLPYSVVHKESEICLITADLPGQAKEHDKAVEHYENLLEKKNVKVKIKKIIPYKQLKDEHSEFELKKRLVRLYDFFLVDGRVSGYVQKKFSNLFRQMRKSPVCIKIDCSNLNDHIQKALLKVELKIHPNGDTFIVQVGHTRMTKEELKQNIIGVFDALDDQFPGGIENIRCIHIKSELSVAIPIYLTLKHNAKVQVPVQQATRPKSHVTAVGEVSTLFDKEMVVFPSGDVKTKKEVLSDKAKKQTTKKKVSPRDAAIAKKEAMKKKLKKKIGLRRAKAAQALQTKEITVVAVKKRMNKRKSLQSAANPLPKKKSPKKKAAAKKLQNGSVKAPAGKKIKQENVTVKQEKVAVKQEKVALKPQKVTLKPQKVTLKPQKVTLKPQKVRVKQEKVTVKQEKVTVKQENGVQKATPKKKRGGKQLPKKATPAVKKVPMKSKAKVLNKKQKAKDLSNTQNKKGAKSKKVMKERTVFFSR